MYEAFYGLSRTPFAVTPDPAMLYMSKVHREALATIIYGIETRKGFIVCTGEVGTGKSTIVRAYFDQALADAVKLIYIFTPQVSPLEMARYICAELGLSDPESIFAAVPALQLKLLEEFEGSRTIVLMIDEAQLLPPETLEFLRLLSNFETDTEKLIQIVLVGQPEVDTMLARRDMRQVSQRVALRARLSPLSVEESFAYIDHRLRAGGAADLAQVMSPSAAWLTAEAAGGIPRVINILADNVLIAGFGAAQRPVGSQLAGATIRDFVAKSGPAKPATPRRAGWRAAMRLKGALAREKDEPEAWVPAISAPADRREAPVAPPSGRAETAEAPAVTELPQQPKQSQAAVRYEPTHPPAPSLQPPQAPARLMPSESPVASAAEPGTANSQTRAPAGSPAVPAPKWVEPLPIESSERVSLPAETVEYLPLLVEPEPMPLLVEPVQYEPLPVDPDPMPVSGNEPAVPGHQPAVAERSRRTVFVLPQPRVALPRPASSANGSRAAPIALPQPAGPQAAGPPAQWPALSRVRLRLPPARSHMRDRR